MFKNNLIADTRAGFVVFMVALPLCLGIASGSDAPLFSGIIAGIIGGIVVGFFSGSQVGVSGPAAGLTTIVSAAIVSLGDWSIFTLAVVIAGVIQLLAGFLRAGVITHFFPNAVIRGMLVSIGLVIVIKQIPHAFGYDADYEGDMNFIEKNQENTFSELGIMFAKMHGGALLITAVVLPLLFIWEIVLSKKNKFFRSIPGPLAIIIIAIFMNEIYKYTYPSFVLKGAELVSLPILYNEGIEGNILLPDFSQLGNLHVYKAALIIALIASIETLLSTKATDKLDPMKRNTPSDQELKAQGVGNIFSGLIGGLPITQVIVRSSANISFGAKSKWSAVIHGFFLLIAVLFLPTVLNLIPMAVLACILLYVGYKLINPVEFIKQFHKEIDQYLPFVVTIIFTLFTDLLSGVGAGFAVAVLFILLRNKISSKKIKLEKLHDQKFVIHIPKKNHFFSKKKLLDLINKIPAESYLHIKSNGKSSLDPDLHDLINDQKFYFKKKNISLTLITQ